MKKRNLKRIRSARDKFNWKISRLEKHKRINQVQDDNDYDDDNDNKNNKLDGLTETLKGKKLTISIFDSRFLNFISRFRVSGFGFFILIFFRIF